MKSGDEDDQWSILNQQTLSPGSDAGHVYPPREAPEESSPSPGHRHVGQTGLGQVGRYTIQEEVGRGASGVVYRAYDPILQRDVALKMLLHGSFASDTQRRRFEREARVVASLDHPNIVRIHDTGSYQGAPYFTMDLLSDEPLAQVLGRGPLQPTRAAEVVAQLARALHHAHSHGIVHRDIKPANVLMGPDGRPHLSDFGVARIWDWTQTGLTATGQLVGTPSYMAPEQIGGADVGPAADVFSLGAVLYACLTGRAPFLGETLESLAQRQHLDAPSPRRWLATLPVDLDLITRMSMESRPEDRYTTALQMAEDLERFIKGEVVLATRPSLGRRVMGITRRHSRMILLGVALTLPVVAVATSRMWDHWQLRMAESQREEAAQHQLANLTARLEADWRNHQDEEARRAYEAFLEMPGIRETDAAGQAVLLWAKHELEVQHYEMAYKEASRAYILTRKAILQLEALDLLLAGLYHSGGYAGARGVGRLLVALGPERSATSGLGALYLASAHRDLGRLSDLYAGSAPDLSGVLREWSTARPLGIYLGAPTAVRTRGLDATPTRLRPELSRGDYLIPDPSGPLSASLFRQLAFAEPQRVREPIFDLGVVESRPRLLVNLNNERGEPVSSAIYDYTPTGLEKRFELGPRQSLSACYGDVDGDGQVEYYASQYRTLVRVVYGGDGSLKFAPMPEHITSVNSEPRACFVADLEGDGSQELVLALEMFRALDIRVLKWDAAQGQLVLHARRKIGQMMDVAPLPLPGGGTDILTNRYSTSSFPHIFPQETPYGLPPGLYRIRLEGDKLTLQDHVPPPSPSDHLGPLSVADFDGDGRFEVAQSVYAPPLGYGGRLKDMQFHTQLVTFPPEGRARAVLLPDLELMGTVQGDGDPAAELLVRTPPDAHMWMLGAGTSPTPTLPSPAPVTISDGYTSDTWQRAEQLLTVALMDERLEPMAQLAANASTTDEAVAALVAQGDLLRERGAQSRAAHMYERARKTKPGDRHTCQLAAAQWRELGRGREEAEALACPNEELVALDLDPQRQAELKRRFSLPAYTLPEGDELDPAWNIVSPGEVRWDRHSRVLAVRGMGEDRIIARLPLRWEGDYLSLSLDLDLHRVEQGSGIRIGLRPLGQKSAQPDLTMEMAGWGGGGLINQALWAWWGRPKERRLWAREIGRATTPIDVQCSIQIDRKSRVVVIQDGDDTALFEEPVDQRLEPGDYELVIESTGVWHNQVQVMELDIRRMEVRGATIVPRKGEDIGAQARRLMAEGRFYEAKQLVGDLSPGTIEQSLLELTTSCVTGPDSQCEGNLRRMMESGAEGRQAALQELRIYLRRSPGLFMPLALRILGAEAILQFDQTWGLAAHAHPGDIATNLAMTSALSAVDLSSYLDGATAELGLSVVQLATFRSRALRAEGDVQSLLTGLEQVSARVPELLPLFPPGPELADLVWAGVNLELEMVFIWAAVHNVQQVIHHLERAMALTSARELIEDRALSNGDVLRLVSQSPQLASMVPTRTSYRLPDNFPESHPTE